VVTAWVPLLVSGGSAGRSGDGDSEGGKLCLVLFFTGATAAFFFAGAFRPRRCDDAGRPEATSADGLPAPPGLATTPLECGQSGPSVNRISRPRPHILVIAPRPGLYLGALACFGFAASLGAYLWLSPPLEGGLWLVVAVIFMLWLGGQVLQNVERHVFDLRRGTYRRSNVLRWGRTIPLSAVRAVQLLTEVPREHAREPRGRRYFAFQLNVVLHDPARPRRLLFEDSDRGTAVRIGRELSEFLGLPLYRTALPPPDA
jgi:hypothetical protein